jgi:hypothetical protein
VRNRLEDTVLALRFLRHESCSVLPMNIRPKSLTGIALVAFLVMVRPADGAPTLRAEVLDDRAVAGRPVHVEYAVEWEGAPDAYVVEPPVLDVAHDWTSAEVVRSAARVDNGVNSLRYTLALETDNPGEHQTPVVTVAYYPTVSGESEPVKDVLYSERFPVRVGRPFDARLYPVIALAVALTVLAGGYALRVRRMRQAAMPGAGLEDPVPSILHAARGHRLDGDYYAYYRELSRAVSHLSNVPEAKALKTRLKEMSDAVGYKAAVPTPDELDGDLRDVERAYTSWKQTMHAKQA